jgi:hypothetical protein
MGQPQPTTPASIQHWMPPPSYRVPRDQQGGLNVLAVVSVVAGLTWVWAHENFMLLASGSVLAVITGHVAFHRIRTRGQRGLTVAVIGLVIGYVGVLWLAFVLVLSALIGAGD